MKTVYCAKCFRIYELKDNKVKCPACGHGKAFLANLDNDNTEIKSADSTRKGTQSPKA